VKEHNFVENGEFLGSFKDFVDRFLEPVDDGLVAY